MGFFSLKQTCSICGNDCGLNRFQIKDNGWCCSKCFKNAGLSMASSIGTMSAEDIKSIIRQREIDADKLLSFTITKEVGNYLKVDENSRQWYIPDGLLGKTKNPRIHSYDDVLDYELLEDGGSIVKGGLGRAVAGGVLLGGVGAVIGGVTGKKKSKPTCTSLKVKITLNDMTKPIEYINLITRETKKSGSLYQICERQAQEIISVFQVICEQNKTANITAAQSQEADSAVEIKKYKELLDSGAITQEEFSLKKKQLLGL